MATRAERAGQAGHYLMTVCTAVYGRVRYRNRTVQKADMLLDGRRVVRSSTVGTVLGTAVHRIRYGLQPYLRGGICFDRGTRCRASGPRGGFFLPQLSVRLQEKGIFSRGVHHSQCHLIVCSDTRLTA